MKRLDLVLILLFSATIVFANSVTSIETNNTPVSGYSGEAYTDPTTHVAAPSTNGTHIVDFVGTGITATQTPNYNGSGLSQVSVNLNGLQTTQSISNTNNINTLNSSLNTTNTNVTTLNSTVSNLNSTVVHNNSIVNTLQTQTNTNTTNITSLNTSVSSIDTSLDSFNSSLNTTNNNVSTLSTGLTNETVRAETVENSLQTQINTTNSNVSNLNTRVDNLERFKFMPEADVRFYDSKHLSMVAYDAYDATNGRNFSGGARVTLKLGKSYEEKVLEAQKKQLDAQNAELFELHRLLRNLTAKSQK